MPRTPEKKVRRGGVGERGREEGLRPLPFFGGRHGLSSPRVGGAMTVSRVEARRGALAAPAGDPLSQGEGEQGTGRRGCLSLPRCHSPHYVITYYNKCYLTPNASNAK